MDWMPTLVSAIGSIRLILIFSGILMLLRCIFKSYTASEQQKKCFAISGVLYLLGLVPQSLLLLFTNSETVNYLLDSGYLCWIQKFACVMAVSLHSLIFLNWIYTAVRHSYGISPNGSKEFIKQKDFFYILVLYVMLLAIGRLFFLKVDDGRKFYMDVASRTDNASFIGWTIAPVQNPVQVVRLQLLLCESSLSTSDMKYFLTVCYLLFFLPLVIMFFILKSSFPQAQQSMNGKTNEICHLDSTEGWQHHTWWEQEINIQKVLSASVTFWYFVAQPIVFAFQRQHFIDFGTHLLLTICVFIPWTLTSIEEKSTPSWV